MKKTTWWKSFALAPLAIAPVAVVGSCSIVKSFFEQNQEDVKAKGFGIWNNDTLDFASANFWNQADVQKATGKQFNIWKDLAAKGQSAKPTMETKVHFLDVGQADATLIEVLPKAGLTGLDKINNSFNILIDSGDFKTGTTENKEIHTPFYKTKLQPTLNQYLDGGRDKIDLFMFSHAHGDHIGQADLVINEFSKQGRSIVVNWGDIKQDSSGFKKMLGATMKNDLIYLDPFVENAIDLNRLLAIKEQDQDPTKASTIKPQVDDPFYQFIDPNNPLSKHYGANENAADPTTWKANGAKLLSLTPGANIINFAPDNFFAYLAPRSDYEPNQPNKSPNENSLNAIFKLANDQGDYRMIFTGDAEGHTHDDMLEAINEQSRFQDQNSKSKLSVDLYKVAHHGSTTEQSNNQSFLAQIAKPGTKMVIQANDNKTFSGSPTLKEQFFKNLDFITSANLKPTDLDQSVMITQNLGDINFIFNNANDLKNPDIITISRSQQQLAQFQLLKLKPGEKVTTNLATKYKPKENANRYDHYLYQPKKI